MARRTIKAAELFDKVAIDLWGTVFNFKEMTLALEEEVAQKWEELEGSDKPLKEELPNILEFIDLFLDPAPKAGTKNATIKPSKVIEERLFKTKDIGMTHVMGIARELLTRGTERP